MILTGHAVVDRSRKLDTRFASHEQALANEVRNVNQLIYSLTSGHLNFCEIKSSEGSALEYWILDDPEWINGLVDAHPMQE
jgi:hypothetical protein